MALGQGVSGLLCQIERNTSAELDLHVTLYNSSTHKTAAVRGWLEKHSCFKLHFTPTSASWLYAVEDWLSQLERLALYRGAFSSVADVKSAIRHFITAHNEHSAKLFKWSKLADAIIGLVHKAKLSAIRSKLKN